MTTKAIHTYEPFGSCDIGQPYEKYDFVQNGSNTPQHLRSIGVFNENPYSLSLGHHVNGGPVTMSDKASDGQEWIVDAATLGGDVAIPLPAQPDDSAVLSKLLEKWRGTEANFAVSAAEGRESYQMMTNRLVSIGRAAREIRRFNLGAAVRHLSSVPRNRKRKAQRKLDTGDLSGTWLELRYGWLPLYSDIHAASKLISDKGMKPMKRTIRTSASVYGQHTRSNSPPSDGQKDIEHVLNRYRHSVKVTVSSNPSLPERLGLTDPLTVAWELVPFSFVADWFLPIQSTLQSIYAVRALPVTRAIKSLCLVQQGSVRLRPGIKYNGFYCLGSTHSTYTNVQMTRSVYGDLSSAYSVSVSNFIPKRNNFLPDISLTRLTDAIALAHQRILSLRRGR